MPSLSSNRTRPSKVILEGLSAVPATLTAFSTATSVIYQISVSNTTAGSLTFLVEDNQTSAQALVPTISIPANTNIIMSWPEGVKMLGGINWQASSTGLTAEIYGMVQT
jgi:hypothetical protein